MDGGGGGGGGARAVRHEQQVRFAGDGKVGPRVAIPMQSRGVQEVDFICLLREAAYLWTSLDPEQHTFWGNSIPIHFTRSKNYATIRSDRQPYSRR